MLVKIVNCDLYYPQDHLGVLQNSMKRVRGF